MPDTGQKDQALITGRIAYGYDGSNAYPLKVAVASSLGVLATDVRNTETVETELFSCATVAASTWATSSVLDLTGVKKATIYADLGRAATAAFLTNGPKFYVQTSQKASGNDTWRIKGSYTCSSTACIAIAASADVAAGGTAIVSTSGTAVSALASGDILFWANTVAASSSEWIRVRAVSGTASFTLIDGLTVGQDADTNLFTQAEHIVFDLDASSDVRARVLMNNNASATTQTIYARIAAITEK